MSGHFCLEYSVWYGHGHPRLNIPWIEVLSIFGEKVLVSNLNIWLKRDTKSFAREVKLWIRMEHSIYASPQSGLFSTCLEATPSHEKDFNATCEVLMENLGAASQSWWWVTPNRKEFVLLSEKQWFQGCGSRGNRYSSLQSKTEESSAAASIPPESPQGCAPRLPLLKGRVGFGQIYRKWGFSQTQPRQQSIAKRQHPKPCLLPAQLPQTTHTKGKVLS